MYKELISDLARENASVKIQPPCSEAALAHAEAAVGHPFPSALRALLREMNGDRWLLFSAEEIAETAASLRENFLPFFEEEHSAAAYQERVGSFLFFASNGCGDYYGYRLAPDGVFAPDVLYRWEHEDIGEDCCWRPVANSLPELIARYYSDEI